MLSGEALIDREGIIPLVTLDDSDLAGHLAHALQAGGLGTVEVALRTPESISAIAKIANSVPNIHVLAGTVLSIDQAQQAVDAGAVGLVSPGFSSEVSRWAAERSIFYVPGVATASDIMAALDLGHRILKFFPAAPLGGLATLSALQAPFAHRGVKFLVTGGMHEEDLETSLAHTFVSAVGGSWIATPTDISTESWDDISTKASNARAIVSRVRPERELA